MSEPLAPAAAPAPDASADAGARGAPTPVDWAGSRVAASAAPRRRLRRSKAARVLLLVVAIMAFVAVRQLAATGMAEALGWVTTTARSFDGTCYAEQDGGGETEVDCATATDAGIPYDKVVSVGSADCPAGQRSVVVFRRFLDGLLTREYAACVTSVTTS